eukprot:Clim_evm45s229 gene=Clim_evmTU45s229
MSQAMTMSFDNDSQQLNMLHMQQREKLDSMRKQIHLQQMHLQSLDLPEFAEPLMNDNMFSSSTARTSTASAVSSKDMEAGSPGSDRGNMCAAFIHTLWSIVNDPSLQDIVQWSVEGTFVVVLDKDAFAERILARFFKHCKVSSFVRQLNMYEFHKMSSTEILAHIQDGLLSYELKGDMKRAEIKALLKNVMAFSHPQFQREKSELLPTIKRRRCNPSKRAQQAKRADSIDSFGFMPQQMDLNPGFSGNVFGNGISPSLFPFDLNPRHSAPAAFGVNLLEEPMKPLTGFDNLFEMFDDIKA